MSIGDDNGTQLETIRGRDFPSIRQFSIFSPNKLGQLLALMRLIENAKLRVCALSISDSSDCAIIRLVVTQPDIAGDLLRTGGYEFCEVDLLVVEVPNKPAPLLAICSSLLQAEVNIHYCFPLLVRPYGRPAMAFYVDDHDLAATVLDKQGFVILTEGDLET